MQLLSYLIGLCLLSVMMMMPFSAASRLLCGPTTAKTLSLADYEASPEPLHFLMSLPIENQVVPFLFNFSRLLPALLEQTAEERSSVYTCFESKNFVFGSSLYYANGPSFSMLCEHEFDASEVAEFRDRFIAKLDCQMSLNSTLLLQDKANEIEIVPYFLLYRLAYCRSRFQYDMFSVSDPVFIWMQSVNLNASPTAREALSSMAQYLIEEGIFLGNATIESSWTTKSGSSNQLGYFFAALHRPSDRSFLQFVYAAPSASTPSIQGTNVEKELFYQIDWSALSQPLSKIIEDRFYIKIARLVASERDLDSIDRYIDSLARVKLDPETQVAAMITHVLVTHLNLVEIASAPAPFLARLLLAHGLGQSVAMRDGSTFSFYDHVHMISHVMHAWLIAFDSSWSYDEAAIVFTCMAHVLHASNLSFNYKALFYAPMTLDHFRKIIAMPHMSNLTHTLHWHPFDLFSSGCLSFAFYGHLEWPDLAWLLTHATEGEGVRVRERFVLLMTGLRERLGVPWPLASVYRCEVVGEWQPLGEYFERMGWEAYQGLSTQRQWHLLWTAYLDTDEIYTAMTWATLDKALTEAELSGMLELSREADEAWALHFSAAATRWSLAVHNESERVTAVHLRTRLGQLKGDESAARCLARLLLLARGSEQELGIVEERPVEKALTLALTFLFVMASGLAFLCYCYPKTSPAGMVAVRNKQLSAAYKNRDEDGDPYHMA